jgi:DNA-binding MarR family transcriptional regulator
MSTTPSPVPEPTDLLGYLLKHASLELTALTDAALSPLGIDSKDFGALRMLARREPSSQLQVAQSLGIDRTSMVSLLDALEGKGLVSRRPDPNDRRRNVVELTDRGAQTWTDGEAAYREAERTFLAPVGRRDADDLRTTLRTLLAD